MRFVKENFDIHAWMGAISAALLFIVAFSGSVALFHNELATWENPERRTAYTEKERSVDAHWDAVKTKAGFNFESFFISLPTSSHPYFMFRNFNPETQESTIVLTHPDTMEIVEAGSSEIAHLLAHLHTDLHLPRPYGRYLVGLTGVIMLLLLISGVFAHRKILKEMFTLHRGKSLRALFSSGHKLLGVWGLPFHLLMAFTGAIIGLLGIIGIFMALSSFGGSVEKAAEAFLGPHAEATGTPAESASIDDIIADTASLWDGFHPTFINIDAAGDEASLITVTGNVDGRLAMSTGATYSFVTGERVHTQDWHSKGLPTLLFGMVVPLHYALFGGVWVKYLYLLLGVGMAFLIISGASIWLDRREQSRRRAGIEGVSIVTRMHTGITAGLVVATCFVFLINHLGSPQNQTMIENISFWGVWLGSIIYAHLRNQTAATVKELLTFSGVALIGAAGLNAIITGDGIFSAYQRQLYNVMAVDITLILCGLIFLVSVWGPALKALYTQKQTVTVDGEPASV